MKHIRFNINDFEFHDAFAYYKSFENGNLTMTVQHLNIHKDAPEDEYDVDMEIANAEVVFKKMCVLSYTGADAICTEGENAFDRFIEQIQQGINIYSFGTENDNIYYLEGSAVEPYFVVHFSVETISIEWDEYKKKAWYELIKRYERDLCLSTNAGDVMVKADIIWNEEVEGEECVSIKITYEHKDYYGHGKDYYWTDAFADLQNNLPQNVGIKCCLTCRHGNFCPVGNALDEVFCTKDVKIIEIEDLWFYTEDEQERVKRLCNYTYFCEDYCVQTDDYITYNDFGCHLRKFSV